MSYREIGMTQLPLTRSLAEEYATGLAWAGERPLSPAHLRWLKNEYDAGRFYSPSWAKAWLHGRAYRVNGQHSSHMLTALNGAFPTNLKAHITEFSCDTESDLIALFASFDSRNSARGGSDYAKASMALHGEFCADDKFRDSAPSPQVAYKLASGIAIYLDDGARTKMTPRDRSMLINEDPSFISAAAVYVSKHMTSTGVCAALYATWKANQTVWSEFWDGVLNESDPNPQAPTRVLIRMLRGEKRGSSKADTRAVYVKCLHAWNAYRAGKSTALVYHTTKPVPDVRK